MHYRIDSVKIKASLTEEGYLLDKEAILGRTGIQLYRNQDGSERRELRLPEEVFNEDSLSSFLGKPVTKGHVDFVTVSNHRQLSVGAILSPGRQDGDHVVGTVQITDSDVIKELTEDKKNRELSLGYKVILDETPGEWNGQRYDAIQRKISINHLALVDKGRAGVAKLNLDGAGISCAYLVSSREDFIKEEDNTMTQPNGSLSTLRLDTGLTYQVPSEVEVAFNTLNKKLDAASEKLANVANDLKKAEQEKKDAEDALVKAKKDAVENAMNEVKTRLSIEEKANALGVKHDGVDNLEVMKAVIAKSGNKVDLTEKADAYIQAAFDMVDVKVKQDAMAKTAPVSKNAYNLDGVSDAEKSRQAYIDRINGVK